MKYATPRSTASIISATVNEAAKTSSKFEREAEDFCFSDFSKWEEYFCNKKWIGHVKFIMELAPSLSVKSSLLLLLRQDGKMVNLVREAARGYPNMNVEQDETEDDRFARGQEQLKLAFLQDIVDE